MYPIFVMVTMFGPKLKNSNILFHCDNVAVTRIINKQSNKKAFIMRVVRPLVLTLIQFNISLKCKHIPGVLNTLPARISRFQVMSELLRCHGMKPEPTDIPAPLLPVNFDIN